MKIKKNLMVKTLVGIFALIFAIFVVSCASIMGLGEPLSSDWPDLRIRYDEFNKISFIESSHLNYNGLGGGHWHLYIAVSENSKVLRLNLGYSGSGWIFFDKAILINDQGNNIQYTFNQSDLKRKVRYGGSVGESVDIALSVFIDETGEIAELTKKIQQIQQSDVSEDVKALLGIKQHSDVAKIKELKELLGGTNIRLRLTGDSYSEFKIPNSNVISLKSMIAYYESITAKIE
jgi:hypothetical protein